ncbi:MAG: ribonuclease HII [Bacteroidales bacterium]|nr:ribonuclease HII [Bacteroidales bacterium]
MYSPLFPHLIAGRKEAGCDESGRGSLAGPVFTAAVILPCGFSHPLLQDSKKMSEKQRLKVGEYIEKHALCLGVSWCSAAEVDRWNILRASITAMHRALDKLSITPEFILVDGNRFYPYLPPGKDPLPGNLIPHQCFVKGDARFASIAAASVLAKNYRDRYMKELDSWFPGYGWGRNKGYPTEEHRIALKKHGATLQHRKSFSYHL